MTKFILSGGPSKEKSANQQAFFYEVVKGLPEPIKILGVYFARKKEQWPGLFEQEKRKLSSLSPKKNLEFVLADEDKNVFIQQLQSTTVVFIRGGNELLLKKHLGGIENLNELFQDKVIAGSSAGANILAQYYYANDRDRIEEGLGILPIKAFCHYTDQKREKLEKLKQYGQELKIYAIPEGKYYVIER